MSHAEIIRAWKDPVYRSTLSVAPTHPAGFIELADRKKNVYDQDLLALLPIERRVAPASAGTSGVAQPLQS